MENYLNTGGVPSAPEKTACFTGHRAIPAEVMEKLISELDDVLEKCISEGYDCFIAGGAIGFDTVAAFRVLSARESHPDIKLVLALPCRNQTERWTSLKNLKEYQILKDNADAVIYLQNFYDSECMMKRNRFMVDMSSLCIGYVTKSSGGSAATMRYAQKKNIKCLNIGDSI